VDAAGDFVVVWTSYGQDGASQGVFGQRFASTGGPLGPEFRVNTYTTSSQFVPAVASDPAGDFVVAWQSHQPDGTGHGVFGERFAASGAALGPEFRANTSTTLTQGYPSVAASPSGDFIVVWTGHDSSIEGVEGQRFAAGGAPLGPEFHVNTYTYGFQIN